MVSRGLMKQQELEKLAGRLEAAKDCAEEGMGLISDAFGECDELPVDEVDLEDVAHIVEDARERLRTGMINLKEIAEELEPLTGVIP